MKPVKAKTLINKTAAQLDIPEEVLKRMVDFYYKQLRKSLSTFKGHRIWIAGVGYFYLKKRVISNYTARYQRMLNHIESKKELTNREVHIVEELRTQLGLFEKTNMFFLFEKEKIHEHYIRKINYKNEKAKKNNEGLAENTAGSLQQISEQTSAESNSGNDDEQD